MTEPIVLPQTDAQWHRRDWVKEPSIPDRALDITDPSTALRAMFRPVGDMTSMKVDVGFAQQILDVHRAVNDIPDSRLDDATVVDVYERLHHASKLIQELPVDDPALGALARAVRHDVRGPLAKATTAVSSFREPSINRNAMFDENRTIGEVIQETFARAFGVAKPAAEGWFRTISFINNHGTVMAISGEQLVDKLRQVLRTPPVEPSEARLVTLSHARFPSGPLEILFGNLRSNSEGVRNDRKARGLDVGSEDVRWGYYFIEDSGSFMVVRAWDYAGGFSADVMPAGQIPLLGKSARSGGTGLGLQLVDDMAAGFGGGVEVGNWSMEPGGVVKGACFSIIVPLVRIDKTLFGSFPQKQIDA